MKKIVEYKIVTGPDPDALQEKVKRMIDNGFEPFGSLFVMHTATFDQLYQPVVKYEA